MTKTFSTFVVFSLIFSICFSAVTNNVLSDSDKKALLEMHNDARTKTAQGNMTCNNYGGVCPAGEISDLVWDETVAESAQKQANTLQTNCQFAHIGGHSYGENLAATSSTSASYVSVCDGWIEPEALKYCYGEDTTGNGGQNNFYEIGHFTQVVSERTTKLGCGCADNTDCQWRRLCVCQYDSPGNYGGDTVPGGIKYPYKSNSDSYSCGNSPEPTENPVPAPTSSPIETKITEKPDDADDNPDSSSCSTITISGIAYSPFNGDWTCEVDETYGNVYSKGSYYFFYNTYYGNPRWMIGKSIGTYSYYGMSKCNNCPASECNDWTDWTVSWDSSNAYVIAVKDGSAYSSSSSSNDSDNELIEGLLIGLGIAIGIFLIALLVYYCIKRKNNQKNQYNVVEMNNNENSISNHEYVTMQN